MFFPSSPESISIVTHNSEILLQMVNTYIADIGDKGFGLIINSVYTQRLTTMIKGLCVLNCNVKILCIQTADLIICKTFSVTKIRIELKNDVFCCENLLFSAVPDILDDAIFHCVLLCRFFRHVGNNFFFPPVIPDDGQRLKSPSFWVLYTVVRTL
jgi:hypothetical protein